MMIDKVREGKVENICTWIDQHVALAHRIWYSSQSLIRGFSGPTRPASRSFVSRVNHFVTGTNTNSERKIVGALAAPLRSFVFPTLSTRSSSKLLNLRHHRILLDVILRLAANQFTTSDDMLHGCSWRAWQLCYLWTCGMWSFV